MRSKSEIMYTSDFLKLIIEYHFIGRLKGVICELSKVLEKKK